MIAIGASTGGTEAILEVVKNFPENTPGVVSPSTACRFYSHVCRPFKQDRKMEVREAKRGPDPQRSHAFSSRRSQMRVVPLGNSYAVSVQEEKR